jgi:uncharacterized protein YggU (UPF0235/DUF167 family)
MIWGDMVQKLKSEALIKLKVYTQTKRKAIKNLEKHKKSYLTLQLLVIMTNSKKNQLVEEDSLQIQMNI